MKRLFVFTFLMVTFCIAEVSAQKTGKLTVNASYTGIVEGYDHINKNQLYVDGVLVAESEPGLQSVPQVITVNIQRGSHTIRVVNLAQYEGNWEEHTKANDYSVDATLETTVTMKKRLNVDLVYDIDKEETRSSFR